MLTSDKLGCWLALCDWADLYNTGELWPHYLPSSSEVSEMEDLGKGEAEKFLPK